MTEFYKGMTPSEYRQLTNTQRSYLWVGALLAAFFQGLLCFLMGIVAHGLNHGG